MAAKKVPELPKFKEGWDAKNNTYNGVYAVKKGNKIFGNTGIIMFTEPPTKDQKPYRQGITTTKAQFDREVKRLSQPPETLILTEKDHAGTMKRLMVRVK